MANWAVLTIRNWNFPFLTWLITQESSLDLASTLDRLNIVVFREHLTISF
jgi:hypothetical protein